MTRSLIALAIGVVLFSPSAAYAQAKSPAASPAPTPAGNLESSKDYKETQDVINKTQARIDQVRRDNDARAKEIEAIANKVGDVISTMSSQGEDNSSLRSEMAKLIGQLDLERDTAKGLRAELAKLNEKIKADQAGRGDLDVRLREAQEANRETEKRLSAALESIAGHARVNRQLVSDVENLQKEVEQLRRENELIRRLRSSNPSVPLPR